MMYRKSFLYLIPATALALAGTGPALGAADGPQIDPFTDNLLVDGRLQLEQPGSPGKSPKVHLVTPRYWTLTSGDKKWEGQDLPFDRKVKCTGDCSIRMDGTGGKMVFSRSGWGDTSPTMRHGWGYTASVRLKLKDVRGKVWVEVSYSWNRVRSKDLSGTMDWTELPLEFVLDRGTNLLQNLAVHFEGQGTVWVGDLQLRMKNP
jgi:hypothetical protein